MMQRRYPFRLIAILSQALLSQIVEPDLLLASLLVDELVGVDPPSPLGLQVPEVMRVPG